VGVGQLVLGELAGPVAHDEALRIDEPAALARLGLAEAFLPGGGHEEIGDAGAGLAGAEEEQLLVAQLAAGQAQPGEEPASATEAVPWMSSLKLQIWSRYWLSRRKALVLPKSSHWSSALG
jgi:hypothetical protein